MQHRPLGVAGDAAQRRRRNGGCVAVLLNGGAVALVLCVVACTHGLATFLIVFCQFLKIFTGNPLLKAVDGI